MDIGMLDVALIFALIMSVVIHEMAHAYAASWQGDPTARLQGRLSPNPVVHLDPFMSVLLPAFLILTSSPFLFGAAKPVPYNPYNFRNQRWGEAIVAAAGPASNIVLALIFAGIVRMADVLSLSDTFIILSVQIVFLNIFLAFFNLVPIPPLDGSKILPRFLPFGLSRQYEAFRAYFEQNVMLGFLLVIFLFYYFLGRPLQELTLWLGTLMFGV